MQARGTSKLRRTLGHGREGIAIVKGGRQDSRCGSIEILYLGVSLEQMKHIEKLSGPIHHDKIRFPYSLTYTISPEGIENVQGNVRTSCKGHQSITNSPVLWHYLSAGISRNFHFLMEIKSFM